MISNGIHWKPSVNCLQQKCELLELIECKQSAHQWNVNELLFFLTFCSLGGWVEIAREKKKIRTYSNISPIFSKCIFKWIAGIFSISAASTLQYNWTLLFLCVSTFFFCFFFLIIIFFFFFFFLTTPLYFRFAQHNSHITNWFKKQKSKKKNGRKFTNALNKIFQLNRSNCMKKIAYLLSCQLVLFWLCSVPVYTQFFFFFVFTSYIQLGRW